MVADPARKKPSTLPFPAIVGQPDLKQVLLLAAVHDDLGGALVAGEKGTAKSTAVRGLVDLLGDQQVVADCPYGCSPDDPAAQCADCEARPREELQVETRPVPLVTLPLGATRDRVVGTLSIEEAMAGESEFDPGLLARANRGILYVDEINLLDDHLVDVLLDAAASGRNTVERDGISVSHPAEFTLIGTMNPEEGDLRPQLRDRFDLQATVEGSRDLDDRIEIIDRALSEDETESYETEVDHLRKTLQAARDSVDSVELPTSFKKTIAELCIEANVDGHRADIATARVAMALAALDGRPKVLESDIQTAARYTLPHRLQSQPFEEPPDPDELLDDYFDDDEPESEEDGEADSESGEGDADDSANDADTEDSEASTDADESADDDQSTDSDGDQADGDDGDQADGDDERGSQTADSGGADHDSKNTDPSDPGDEPETSDGGGDGGDETDATPIIPGQQRAEIGDGRAPDLGVDTETQKDDRAGRGGHIQSTAGRGTRVRTERATGDTVDAAASVRAAAASGHDRVERDDLRQSVRERETAATIVFAVDASASMRPAMEAAKGVLLDLLREAYESRDGVAFVAFGGDEAEVVLPPTRSLSLAARHLKELPTGDRTPLPDGLRTAHEVLEAADTDQGVVVLVTDGRATVADGSPTQSTREAARRLAASGGSVVVVDAADGRNGLIPMILEETDGERIDLSDLSPKLVATTVERASRSTER